MVPMAHRDADFFAGISAAVVTITSLAGCVLVGWLLLTRRASYTGVEDFLSLVLLGGFLWVLAFLLPKARRERDVFGVVCALLAALLALAGWLLIGSRVQSG